MDNLTFQLKSDWGSGWGGNLQVKDSGIFGGEGMLRPC